MDKNISTSAATAKEAAPRKRGGFFGGVLKHISKLFNDSAPSASSSKSVVSSGKVDVAASPTRKLYDRKLVNNLVFRLHKKEFEIQRIQEEIIFLTAVFDIMSDAGIIANTTGKILKYNEAAQDIFGIDASVAIDYDIFRLLNDRTKPNENIVDWRRHDSADSLSYRTMANGLLPKITSEPALKFSREMITNDNGIRKQRVLVVRNDDKVIPALLTVQFLRNKKLKPLGIVAILDAEKRIDAMTTLHNRRHFDEKIREEYEHLKRGYWQTLSLLMVDIDHFKSINDECGHSIGDEVLHRVGKILAAHTRSNDIPCRYGGEEFAVILPATDENGAAQIAERIRERVAKILVPAPGGIDVTVTASVGIGTHYSNEPKSYPLLVNDADQALYRAKESGRNKVVVFKK